MAADVSEQGNQETARMIEELGTRALPVRCNVSRAEGVKAALDRTIETFERLDLAFNNAGVEQAITATAEITEEEWARIVDYAADSRTAHEEFARPTSFPATRPPPLSTVAADATRSPVELTLYVET